MSITDTIRRAWVLKQRPTGMPDEDTFELVTSPIPSPRRTMAPA